MNLYLIYRVGSVGWNEYDSAVVVAEDELDAKRIHPDGMNEVDDTPDSGSWRPFAQIKVKLIGVANYRTPRGVICASFNAG